MKLLKDMEAKCLEIIIQQLLRGLLCIFHYGSQEIILWILSAIRLSIFAAITRATNIYDMSGSCIVRAAHNLTATQEI